METNRDFNNLGRHLKTIERNIELATKDPILRGGFTQVPNFVLEDAKLGVGAKITYAMFLKYAWDNSYCFPGQERLAKDIGCSERSVHTWMKELETAGLLSVKRRGLGKTNLYTLHFTVKKKRA